MTVPAASAVLAVEHETAFEYGARVDVAYHLAHLCPRQSEWQQLERHHLQIEPQPSSTSEASDVYGNGSSYFAFYVPHEQLTVRAQSTVRIVDRFAAAGVVLAPGDSPAWETVRTSMRYSARAPLSAAAEFCYPSPFIPLLAELAAYAREVFCAERPLFAAAIDLMHRVHGEFKYESGSTEVTTPVLTVFKQRRGVCQDFAHVLIGCLRALGLPARYVSGYLLTTPPPGQPRLLGADASHAWVQVWSPQFGWLDLDPTNDTIPSVAHVMLALGRDYGDVMPLRGVIRGGGEHTLKVAVSVLPVANEDVPAGA